MIKLPPVVPEHLPEEMRQWPALGVEVEVTPEGFVCSASMKGGFLGTTEVREATAGERPIRKSFTREQRAFYDAHVSEGPALDDLLEFFSTELAIQA